MFVRLEDVQLVFQNVCFSKMQLKSYSIFILSQIITQKKNPPKKNIIFSLFLKKKFLVIVFTLSPATAPPRLRWQEDYLISD